MPFIRNLWVATLTKTEAEAGPDSGSEDKIVLIMNQADLDVVHRDIGAAGVTGGGALSRSDISESRVLPENYYVRIGTRGADAWRPSMIAAWCERFTTGNIVPLGYDEKLDTVLSTDASEGRISLPLRRIDRGRSQTVINRVMLVTGTGFGVDWFGTDSPVHLRITGGDSETVLVDHTIPDTDQPDFERAEGNIYFVPVITPFTRSQLDDSSIVLSIEGDDAWQPFVVVMFGLDTESEQPSAMVPLVHEHPWRFGPLSSDPNEGVASVTFPLAPMDS